MISHNDFISIFNYIKERFSITIVESNIDYVRRFVHKKTDNIMDIEEYIELIHNDNNEFDQLLKVITINETYFFREQKYFKLLDEVIFPEFKSTGVHPTIWSGAVSTGEEAISLALLLKKHFIANNLRKPIIATDIDVLSMACLDKNSYNISSVRGDGDIFHELIFNNSIKDDKRIIFNSDVLNLIETKKINLILDDYRTVLGCEVSVICLCNVLIYMNFQERKSIIERAVTVLVDGGYLIVSSSSTAFIEHPQLELIQWENCFYFKKRERS